MNSYFGFDTWRGLNSGYNIFSQFANADYIHEKAIGIKFDINAFSEEMLINGVMEVSYFITGGGRSD